MVVHRLNMIASETLQRLAHERELTCAAVLFDLDGVLVGSAAQIERHWQAWAKRRYLSFTALEPLIHGRRSADTLRLVAPELDAEHEGWLVNNAQTRDSRDVHALPGVRRLLKRLPTDHWGIVTSASRALAQARLRAARLPQPKTLVSGDDVAAGKPHPAGYLEAAHRLGVDAGACVAFEDAPAGIMAAKAAGMTAVAIATTQPTHDLAGADHLVADLRGIFVAKTEPMLRLRIWDATAPPGGRAA
jgi:sugar-phosphatase